MQTIKDQERWNGDPKGSDCGLFRGIRQRTFLPLKKRNGGGNITRGRKLKSVENFFWNSFTCLSTVHQIAMQLHTRILRNVVRDGFTGAAVVNVENFRERKCNCRSRTMLRLARNSRRLLTGYREQRWAYKEARPTDPRPDKKLFTSRLIRS